MVGSFLTAVSEAVSGWFILSAFSDAVDGCFISRAVLPSICPGFRAVSETVTVCGCYEKLPVSALYISRVCVSCKQCIKYTGGFFIFLHHWPRSPFIPPFPEGHNFKCLKSYNSLVKGFLSLLSIYANDVYCTRLTC